MSAQTSPPGKSGSTNANQPAYPATKKKSTALLEGPLTSHSLADEYEQRQAETFYLQKQVQLQTPMMIVLEDGEEVEGCIEWYDRNTLKIRGRMRSMIYKAAIKYMYKVGEK
jgi:sRNA-binding regulator protein Hfq